METTWRETLSPVVLAVLESLLSDNSSVHVALLQPLYDTLDCLGSRELALQLVALWIHDCDGWIGDIGVSEEFRWKRHQAVFKLEHLLLIYAEDIELNSPTYLTTENEGFPGSPPVHYRGGLNNDWDLQDANVAYDALSPVRQFTPTSFSRSLVYRSIGPLIESNEMDQVLFTAYSLPSVNATTMRSFPFSIWAFLAQQRNEMHELASAADTQHVSRDLLFPLRRGALVHVRLDVPDGFIILDDKIKAMTWQGEVTGVDFQVQCTSTTISGQVLFKATVVFGARVLVLRAYVFVGCVSTYPSRGFHEEDESLLTPLKSELELLEATSYQEIPFHELNMGDLVGKGHFGDAYRATYRGQEVVVKTLRTHDLGSSNDEIVQEFRHEAAVLSMFGHHPNIVPFVGASTDPTSTLTLVTEYLPYGSLEEQLLNEEKQPWSLHMKGVIAADAAAGLLNIHEGGFLHRDIAARNCLVDGEFRAKICDFGMCRRADRRVGGGLNFSSGIGPLQYMAPESLQPPHSFSYKSDVYSFGVLLWETFSESRPFPGMSGAETAAYVLEGGRLDGSISLPRPYQPLLASCFHEDPSLRPTMSNVVEILYDILQIT